MKAVILTKSVKGNRDENGNLISYGACVTGLDEETGRIVRFIDENGGNSIPDKVAEKFKEFDVVTVKTGEKCPEGPQQENIYVDCSTFEVTGHCSSTDAIIEEYKKIPQPDGSFLEDVEYALASVSQYSHSLEIVKVRNLHIYNRNTAEKKKRAYFAIGDKWYKDFRVTDAKYRENTDDSIDYWHCSNAVLVISIPIKPHVDGLYYKFVAAVVPTSKMNCEIKESYKQL